MSENKNVDTAPLDESVMSTTPADGETFTTLDNVMPAPPKDGGTAKPQDNVMPSGPAAESVGPVETKDNVMPAPPALGLGNR
ncbi:hypothetical protein GCM10010145_02080 [Streptomyces ruber]|uniref:Sigma-like protein n=2 Tax=Streptomyces TaxID=1883 RepID=A0A918B6A5_9ACTN|nr:sigma-like protein [Streptomyces ruber]GGQ38359.1 hypothetical protein GCM10010145_02080 [Streptomyces ruber]